MARRYIQITPGELFQTYHDPVWMNRRRSHTIEIASRLAEIVAGGQTLIISDTGFTSRFPDQEVTAALLQDQLGAPIRLMAGRDFHSEVTAAWDRYDTLISICYPGVARQPLEYASRRLWQSCTNPFSFWRDTGHTELCQAFIVEPSFTTKFGWLIDDPCTELWNTIPQGQRR